ncbi:MAG: spore coat protein CotJB [Brotaphodocola sp.]
MMQSNRNSLLRNVYETGFALDDIILYLDTHPTDQDAMNYYRQVQMANQQAVRAYEQMNGPLMADRAASDHWDWIQSPWPWEGDER